MYDKILDSISQMNTPGFFITVEYSQSSELMPQDIEVFIREKINLINQGCKARKFVYKRSGWRLIFTFFPTNRVVEERYALKNKAHK